MGTERASVPQGWRAVDRMKRGKEEQKKKSGGKKKRHTKCPSDSTVVDMCQNIMCSKVCCVLERVTS